MTTRPLCYRSALAVLVCLCALTACGRRAEPGGTKAADSPLPIRLADVAAVSGLTYQWPALPRPLGTREAFGKGCAFLDFDGDGWQDVLLVGTPHPILYKNLGNGRFRDASEATGLAGLDGEWFGCAVGDYNGDGFPDVLLTGFHRLALLKNGGGRRFVDNTRAAGLDSRNHGHWGASAGFMDLDGDGRLDLIVLNYVVFGPNTPNLCEQTPGFKTGCPPSTYEGERPEVWRSTGGGRFQDVTAASGMQAAHGKALVLAFTDIDGDGRPDVYIGNDGQQADLMRNLGRVRFRNIGTLSGVDSTEDGSAVSAMGADWADYDRDGRLDLIVSNFSGQPYQLFHNGGSLLFDHKERAIGLADPTFQPLGFGVKWADVDNDGWPDVLFANGHVYDEPGRIDHYSTLRQPLMLFHNEQGKRLTNLAPRLGGDLARPILGRGLATGDYDNDGRMDFLAVDLEGAPLLLHNLSETPNHWITFDLRGRAPNTLAYGAQITARAGGQTWVGDVSPASSYLSSSDPRVHLGLGPVAVLETVSIRWPDGRKQQVRQVKADRILRITESTP